MTPGRNASIYGLFLLVMYLLLSGSALGEETKQFRVCADPENLPFTNRRLEGFENKIAELIAKEFGASPTYIWWGQRIGFIKNTMKATLKEARCDVVMGVPKGYDLVRWTKPYYRSTYVFVYSKDKGLQVKSLDDPILRQVKIGVHLLGNDYTNPPPVHELGRRGIVDNVVGYSTFYSLENSPGRIIEAVAAGEIDVAIVWGPVAGYFAKKQRVPLELVPVPSREGDLPFTFDISMGVRPGEEELKAQLEGVLDRKQAEIRKILEDYGVPLMDGKKNTPSEVYKRVYNGWKWWHVYCYRCHGADALGSPLAPNLSDPSRKLTYEEFLQTTRNGAPQKGMPAWNQLLDDKQITDIYFYVRARTERVLPPGRPDEAGANGAPWIPPEGWPKAQSVAPSP